MPDARAIPQQPPPGARSGTIWRAFEQIIIPAPIDHYCTSRVLTMEFVPGKKVTDLSPLARMEFDGAALAEELFRAYHEQILVSGFFHADPHPGNVFITAEYRIALLDLGTVGRIMPRLQEDLLQLLLAIAEGQGEEAANTAIEIGEKKEDLDSKEFTRRISEIVAQQKTAIVSKRRSAGSSLKSPRPRRRTRFASHPS